MTRISCFLLVSGAIGAAACSTAPITPSNVTPSTFVMTWQTLAFPSTGIGATALTPVVVTLSNNGTSAVPVASVTDTNTGEFPWTSTCNVAGSLSPGATCAVTAQFSPVSLGARTATLTINANSIAQTFALTGTGIAPVAPQVAVDPVQGPPSTVFTLSVTGLTPGGQATLLTRFVPAQGSSDVPITSTVFTADANGALTIASAPDASGAYENWIVDATSARSSAHVVHTVN